MRLEVLASCMHQDSFDLPGESRISGDALIINQCDREADEEIRRGNARWRMLSTRERGLSRSRNRAIQESSADICLLCDDDEVFADGYEKLILDSFLELPDADIIGFDVEGKTTRLSSETQALGKWKTLRLSSVQLAFRREAVERHHLRFDEHLGSGSGNGPGEENKFLLDCVKQGLKVYYVPKTIARLRNGNLQAGSSNWFTGFDREFFFQRGGSTRYMLGLPVSVLYGFYYLYVKRRFYLPYLTTREAAAALFRGIWENRVARQARKEQEA